MTNKEIAQIPKSESKKFSILCTFKATVSPNEFILYRSIKLSQHTSSVRGMFLKFPNSVLFWYKCINFLVASKLPAFSENAYPSPESTFQWTNGKTAKSSCPIGDVLLLFHVETIGGFLYMFTGQNCRFLPRRQGIPVSRDYFSTGTLSK